MVWLPCTTNGSTGSQQSGRAFNSSSSSRQRRIKATYVANCNKLHYAGLDTSTRFDDGQAVVFPFLTTCLLLGASLAEYGDFAPSRQIQPLPINTRYDATTNDDGIWVYDITKAPKIRYCFCPLANSPEPIISARDYHKGYADSEGSTDTHHATWEESSKLDLIDAAALENAWEQSKFWNDPKSGPLADIADDPNEPRKTLR